MKAFARHQLHQYNEYMCRYIVVLRMKRYQISGNNSHYDEIKYLLFRRISVINTVQVTVQNT